MIVENQVAVIMMTIILLIMMITMIVMSSLIITIFIIVILICKMAVVESPSVNQVSVAESGASCFVNTELVTLLPKMKMMLRF